MICVRIEHRVDVVYYIATNLYKLRPSASKKPENTILWYTESPKLDLDISVPLLSDIHLAELQGSRGQGTDRRAAEI